MKSLSQLLALKRKLRVIAFDDAPFTLERGSPVNITGVVCSDTRFEGMLWGEVKKDGLDSSAVLINLLSKSKFLQQVNVVLTDGIAFGGFNLIDLPQLAQALQRPCIAVMRKPPDLVAIDQALQSFPDYEQRKNILAKAGKIYEHHVTATQSFYYQVSDCEPEEAGLVLEQLTDTGHVPEALRLAHMIGAAVKTGQSSGRA